MCAEAIVEGSMNGTRMVDEADLRVYLDKWDRKYWGTYKVQGPPIFWEEGGRRRRHRQALGWTCCPWAAWGWWGAE